MKLRLIFYIHIKVNYFVRGVMKMSFHIVVSACKEKKTDLLVHLQLLTSISTRPGISKFQNIQNMSTGISELYKTVRSADFEAAKL